MKDVWQQANRVTYSWLGTKPDQHLSVGGPATFIPIVWYAVLDYESLNHKKTQAPRTLVVGA